MKENRGVSNIYNLASGPGKLTQALEIDKSLNGSDLTGNEIFIMENEQKPGKILNSRRIGIKKNMIRNLGSTPPVILYRPKILNNKLFNDRSRNLKNI
jgi:3-methyladenine DNA glycosylase Mpg